MWGYEGEELARHRGDVRAREGLPARRFLHHRFLSHQRDAVLRRSRAEAGAVGRVAGHHGSRGAKFAAATRAASISSRINCCAAQTRGRGGSWRGSACRRRTARWRHELRRRSSTAWPPRYDALWTDHRDRPRAARPGVARRWTRSSSAGERILDIGCGTGEDARISRRAAFTVHAIDASPAMVQVARGARVLRRRVCSAEELGRYRRGRSTARSRISAR